MRWYSLRNNYNDYIHKLLIIIIIIIIIINTIPVMVKPPKTVHDTSVQRMKFF
jgi:thiamine transporter ThiT